jgi:hypothetical protein
MTKRQGRASTDDQKQYFELKTVLTEKLTGLGFTVKSESTKGLGGSIDFEKDGFLVELVFDLRDRMLFLDTSKDSQPTGKASFSTGKGLETTFFTKLNEILATQGLEVEVPTKSGGFLSKLFGKK